MSSVADLFPPLGLTIEAGPLVLRGISDDVLAELCDLAVGGIHDPAVMPFSVPWTDAPPEQLARNTAAYHWRARAEFRPDAWGLHLAVFHDGQLVGTQAFETSDYLVTRTGETGSWLGRQFHGRGIGTAMRQVVCAFAFDHLGAAAVTSGAFLDNPASLAVSRKLGYRPNGIRRLKRREGELALNQALLLEPQDLVRGPHPLRVSGLAALREAIGLDAA
ncbi:GNAT family N-acetyltransferase [Nocardioides sp. SYSU D00065]|uniref:GNAT family N-acetyltransferase n=1 Tax=Nocardioides sp. SYSU D00065 TaxID=2817378 RepID=UPI001B32959E|nr:GNAT family protein [Nocardioides sp. SYSU D00065]